jgi:glycosyltransferase involved in cell wall biosynthesis
LAWSNEGIHVWRASLTEWHYERSNQVSSSRKALIVVENSFVPFDIRVWYEATTLRDAEWETVVICPAPTGVHAANTAPVNAGAPVDLEGVMVYHFPLTSAEQGVVSYLVEYLSAFNSIARLSWHVWRQGRFDIIHNCNPPDIFFPIAMLFRLLGARVIFDHHDLFPEFIAYRYPGLTGRLLHAVARVMEYLTLRTAHVIISTNQSYRRVAMKRGRLPADRVLVVRNGPKTKEFTPVQPVPALKRDFRHMVCYAGVMGHEDGVLELIKSIRYVVHDLGRRDILFVLLGDGAARPEALAKVDEWGLEALVDMPGMIRDKELLRQYLCTADVCVSPEPLTPLNRRSTFIKIGEYMTMGKPVVAYSLDESRYTAQEAALYVEPGNVGAFGQAIVTLLNDAERRSRMGKLGQQRILEHLSWEHQQWNLFRAYAIALETWPKSS